MRIAKKKNGLAIQSAQMLSKDKCTDASRDKYADSIDYIRSAISALGPIAKDDELAKDAIANLSVVLFDLQ